MTVQEIIKQALIGRRVILFDGSIEESNHVPGQWKPDTRIYPLIEDVSFRNIDSSIDLYLYLDEEARNSLSPSSKSNFPRWSYNLGLGEFINFKLKE